MMFFATNAVRETSVVRMCCEVSEPKKSMRRIALSVIATTSNVHTPISSANATLDDFLGSDTSSDSNKGDATLQTYHAPSARHATQIALTMRLTLSRTANTTGSSCISPR